MKDTGLRAAEIMLAKDCDLTDFAVIACDQFTSEPKYWNELRDKVKGKRTALDLVLPEIFLGDGDTGKILALSESEARLALDQNIVTDGDLIESAVERHFVHTDIRPEEGRVSRAYIGRIRENFFTECAQIDTRVFKAVSVAATVEDTVGVDADRSLSVTAETVCQISVFRHIVLPAARCLA